MPADLQRVAARLEELWRIARGPGGGADRPSFSPAEAQAMRLMAGWAVEAGLEPGLDSYGNLWALPPGWEGPLVTSGSHVDTVPDGGRYDGALGAVLGLEAAHALAGGTAGGARPALLICAAEEAPRFGAGTIGSRSLIGRLSDDDLARLHDADGVGARDARAAYLDELSDLPRVEPPLERVRAHAEVHVAQRFDVRALGVVERVAAPRRFEVTLTGESGHAGEVTMADRHDALAAAAEAVLAVERAAARRSAATVATVGRLTVEPGAVTVIPGRVRLALETRSVDADELDAVEAAIRASVTEIAARRGVRAELEQVRGGDPTVLDAALVDAALEAATELGVAAERTWSGGGHDTQHLSARVAGLLLFVPLHGGASHTPQEGADETEIGAAAAVVETVLDRVDA